MYLKVINVHCGGGLFLFGRNVKEGEGFWLRDSLSNNVVKINHINKQLIFK